MNVWKIALIAILLSASGWPLPVEAATKAPDQECVPGLHTTLITRNCVNTWSVKNPNFRWSDLQESCDPKNALCASLLYQPPLALPTSKCRVVKIVEVLPHDHLARIRCINGESDSIPEFIINLDSLSCHPTNTSRYRRNVPLPDSVSNKTGQAIVDQAKARMKTMMDSVTQDTKILVDLALKTDPRKLEQLMTIAHRELSTLLNEVRHKQNLDVVCKPPDGTRLVEGDQIRAQRTCYLLTSTCRVAKNLLKHKGLALKKIIRNNCDLERERNPSNVLAVRMLLFQAFINESPDLPSQLKLIRRSVETGVRDFWELHSGFVFGGRRLKNNGGNGYDCTDFLLSLLKTRGAEPEVFSTETLKTIAQYLEKEISAQILSISSQNLATCFSIVDLRAGEPPWPGDFVINNSETMNSQHAVIVEKLLPNHTILTIEAAGGLINGVTSKNRPLFEPVPKCSKSDEPVPVRPDLYVLRLKAEKPLACPFE